MHLRPGLPGRRGHAGRGRRSEPDLSRVREHGRLRGVLRQTRSQRDLARHRVHGGSGGRFSALLQRGESSAHTSPEHARPGRERPPSTGHRCRSHDGGRTLGDLHHHRSPGVRDQLDQGGQHHSEQLRPRPRHTGCRSRRFAASRSRRRPDLSADGSGGSTPTPTTTHRPAGRDSPVPPAKRASSLSTPTGCWTRRVGACSTTPRARCGQRTDGSNPGPRHGDVEDGYLFAYGDDYSGCPAHPGPAHRSRAPASRGTSSVCGTPTTRPIRAARSRTRVYPEFVANQVPLNTLSLDTDWKAPNDWNGWEWNRSLFPSPSSFLDWARSHGIELTLNIHSSIDDHDPKLSTRRKHGRRLPRLFELHEAPARCGTGALSPRPSPTSLCSRAFSTRAWPSGGLTGVVTTGPILPGLTPDAWIDHLYAQEMINQGQRGFVLARSADPTASRRRSTPLAHGRTTRRPSLSQETPGLLEHPGDRGSVGPDEATIGEPYVSSDIGSYSAPAQPVRRRSSRPLRPLGPTRDLPTDPPAPFQQRESPALAVSPAGAGHHRVLPPTPRNVASLHLHLGRPSQQTGLPMAQPLDPEYPNQPSAYQNPTEYLYGQQHAGRPRNHARHRHLDHGLVPPGPVGRLLHGATFTGPSTATLAVPLDRMPVFVRRGGIVPEQPSTRAQTHPMCSRRSCTPVARVLRPLRRRRNGARIHQGPANRDPHHDVVIKPPTGGPAYG